MNFGEFFFFNHRRAVSGPRGLEPAASRQPPTRDNADALEGFGPESRHGPALEGVREAATDNAGGSPFGRAGR